MFRVGPRPGFRRAEEAADLIDLRLLIEEAVGKLLRADLDDGTFAREIALLFELGQNLE